MVQPSFTDWLRELRALFHVGEEFELADAVYSFRDAYAAGLTPAQAYANFDALVSA